MNLLEKNYPFLKSLCEKHKVKKLYAFGSVLGNEFTAASDIDLVVDFDKMDVKQYADNYFDLKFSLQDLFHRPVDLLEEQAIRNPFFKQSLEQTRQLVYGA